MGVNLIFTGSAKSDTDQYILKCYNNDRDEIYINITGGSEEFICLDIDTAVKFSKQLRKSIANVKDMQDGRR